MIRISKEYYLDLPNESDANDLIENLSDTHISENLLKIPIPYGMNEAMEFIQRTSDYGKNELVLGNRVIRNKDGKMIGGIGSSYVGKEKSKVEIGYWLKRSLHGKGIMTFIVNRYCAHIFFNLDVESIHAHVFDFNHASGSMLLKAGFEQGELLEGYYRKGDRIINAIPYLLLKENFIETRKFTISGQVQGVFYRKYTRLKAIELEIKGNVRNIENGDVQVFGTGSTKNLNVFAEWLKEGSPMSKVKTVDFEPLPLQVFQDFHILES